MVQATKIFALFRYSFSHFQSLPPRMGVCHFMYNVCRYCCICQCVHLDYSLLSAVVHIALHSELRVLIYMILSSVTFRLRILIVAPCIS